MRVHGDAHAGLLFVERAFRKLAVVDHGGRIEQDFACGFIGMAAFDERLNQADHVGPAV